MALIVYGGAMSPFVRKVRVALAEKGLEYSLENINPFAPPPDYEKLHPMKRIPAFRDTDLPEPNTLADSSVICDYLEHKYPKPALYPSDPYQRARALWFEEYADTAVAQAIGPGLFFERVVKKLLKQPPNEELCIATLRDKVPGLFDYLEKEIGNNQFLVGNTFSIADISVASIFVNFAHADEKIDAGRWPKLAAYIARLHGRPSFTGVLEGESKFIQRLKAA
jgi:glutathione S-transferase